MKDEFVDLYLEHINADDPLQIIVRGHLYVESALIALIENYLPNPTGIDLTKFNFPQKLELALALQLLSTEECPSLLQLNKLRNQLAHNLHIELSEKHLTKITQSFDSKSRDTYKNHIRNKSDLKDKLRVAITILYHNLAAKREVWKNARQEIRRRLEKGLNTDISDNDVNKFWLDVKQIP